MKNPFKLISAVFICFIYATGFAGISVTESQLSQQAEQQLQNLKSIAQESSPKTRQIQFELEKEQMRKRLLGQQRAQEQQRAKQNATENLKNLQAMQQQQKAAQMESDEAIDEAAFNEALRNKFPMSPEQILRIKETFKATKFAEESPTGTPPRPMATSQFVNLAPGTTPPVIRLAQGFVSTLVFLDSTGAPWQIESYDLGNPNAFNVQWNKKSHTIMIQAIKLHMYGNIAIKLRDLDTPVLLTLIPGQKAVDYRADLRIQGYGPNAKAFPSGQRLPAGASPILLSLLDGVAPSGAGRLEINGPAEAWAMGNKMYLRTRMTLLSPGWIATMRSADGMNVYEVNKSPVVLVSHNGKILQLKVEGL